MLARNTWYCRPMSVRRPEGSSRKYPAAYMEMPAETEPSSIRKNPARGSMRRWKGRSGSPSGSVRVCGGSHTAWRPKAASATPAAAPSGKAKRLAKAAFAAGISPATATRSHAAPTSSEPASGDGRTPILFHLHTGLSAAVGGKKEQARSVTGCGEHHAFGNAELHLARSEIRNHHGETAF